MMEEVTVVDATSKSGDTAQSTTAQPSPQPPLCASTPARRVRVFQSGCALLQAPVFRTSGLEFGCVRGRTVPTQFLHAVHCG